jgi:hydroxyacylglutathione hydrolase
MRSKFVLFMALVLFAGSPINMQAADSSVSSLAPGTMDVHWNEGAPDCSKSTEPPLQVHPYNAQTFILRENPCATEEAPFMYLLIGSARALLIDTGDVSDPKKMPLASTVIGLLPRGANGGAFPLLILHTHGHLDHRSGDVQFKSFSNVEVIATDLDHVKKFFGFSNWPNGTAQIDLGDRIIDALPAPGHYPSEVSYYDRSTGLFFSGDFFLPGRLIIEDSAADLASAKRVADFIRDRPVTYVLGGHIELDASGEQLTLGTHFHPHEHVLQLTKQDLLALPAVVSNFNGFYSQRGMFVMYNQTRMLEAFGIVLLCVLLGCVLLLRWLVRRRKSAKANKGPCG